MEDFSVKMVLLLKKWGVTEWMQVHGNDFFAKLANCDFCLSWWTNVLLAVAAFMVLGDSRLLLVPFASTMLTRKLI